MERMKIFVLISALIGATLTYRTGIAESGEELRGRWIIVSVPDGWKKVPAVDVVVTGDEIHIRMAKVITSKVSYTLDPANHLVDGRKGDGTVQRGLYRVNGDTLTLCMGAGGKPRPESIESTSGGATRWVLRRAPNQ